MTTPPVPSHAGSKHAAALVAVLVGALTLASFIARSVAATEVDPVKTRVTRLEVQREEDSKKLDELRQDVKAILRAVNDPARKE